MATIGSLTAKIGADTSQLDRAINRSSASFGRFSGSVVKSAKIMTAAIAGIGTAAAIMGSKFEQALKEAAVVAGSTADEFQMLEKRARELGATTAYTATDVAKGMYNLASAGMKATEMSEAVGQALMLAGATASDMTQATGLVVTTLKQFGIEAKNAQKVTDTFAASISNSMLTMDKLTYAMQYAGPEAAAAGWEIEELAAAISTFADIGLEGSMIGTRLRMMFQHLTKVTPEAEEALDSLGLTIDDISPRTHNFAEILQSLAKAQLDSAENAGKASTIFGSRVGATMEMLTKRYREGKISIEEFTKMLLKSQEGTGRTFEMYQEMMDTFHGQFKITLSALQELMLVVFDTFKIQGKEAFRDIADVIARFAEYIKVNWAEDINKGVTAAIESFRIFISIFTEIDSAAKNSTEIFRQFGVRVVDVSAAMTIAIKSVVDVFRYLAQDISLIRLGFLKLTEGHLKLLDVQLKVKQAVQMLKGDEEELRVVLERRMKIQEELVENMKDQSKVADDIIDRDERIRKSSEKMTTEFAELRAEIESLGKNPLKALKDVENQTDKNTKAAENLNETIKKTAIISEEAFNAMMNWQHMVEDMEKEIARDLMTEAEGRIDIIEEEYAKRTQIILSAAESVEWMEEQLTKAEQARANKIEKIHRESMEKLLSLWEKGSNEAHSFFKDLFLHASEEDFDSLLDRMANKLKNWAADMIAAMSVNLFAKMFGAEVPFPEATFGGMDFSIFEKIGDSLRSLFKKAEEAPVTEGTFIGGKFFPAEEVEKEAKAIESTADATEKAGKSFQKIMGFAAGAYGIYQATKAPSAAEGAVSGAMSGVMAGAAFGPVGMVIGGIAGGLAGGLMGGKDHSQRRKRRGEKYAEQLEGWLNAQYDDIEAMYMSISETLLSPKHLYAGRKYAGIGLSDWAYEWQAAMERAKASTESLGNTATHTYKQMQQATRQLMITSPKMAAEMEKAAEKQKQLFTKSIFEDFEKGLVDTENAIKSLVRSGMSQLEAQARLFGESYNELMVMMGGEIETLDETSEQFNELNEVLDILDKGISELPEGMGVVAAKLEAMVYGVRKAINFIQSFVNISEDLEGLPDTWHDISVAMEEGDYEGVAKGLSEVRGIALEVAATMRDLAGIFGDMGIYGLGIAQVFYGIAAALGGIGTVLSVVILAFEILTTSEEKFLILQKNALERLKNFITNLNKLPFIDIPTDWIDEMIDDLDIAIAGIDTMMDKYELWQKQISEMEPSDLISNILDGVKEWEAAIERFSLGPVRYEMKGLLDDVIYAKMMLQEAFEEGYLGKTPEENLANFEKYSNALAEATKIAINEYFDALIDALDEFGRSIETAIGHIRLEAAQERLERATTPGEMGVAFQGLEYAFDTLIGGVSKQIKETWEDMGWYTEEMNPEEYLENAEKLKALVLERYDLEREKIEEIYGAQIQYYEQIKAAWQSVFESINQQIVSIETSGMSPADIFERLAVQMEEVERLRGLYAGAEGVEKARYAGELAAALGQYLTMAGEAYQRPSIQYQNIFESITSELEALRDEAQNQVNYAEEQIITLTQEMHSKLEQLREQTIAELEWIASLTEGAKGVLEGMRDDYLEAVELNVSDLVDWVKEKFSVDFGNMKTNIEGIETNTENIENNTRDIGIYSSYVATNTKTMRGYLKDIRLNIKPWWQKLPSAQHGIPSVPKDMPVWVHKGEEIVPASEKGKDVSVSFSFGDMHINAEGKSGEEFGEEFMSKIETEVKYGRLGMIIKEKIA